MTLLNPTALFFAALVPVVVVLYLLKVRRQDATVSTLLFWRRILAENRRRALWQKLRRPLSLLLQLLLLALVLFALARPEWGAFLLARGTATVVIIDARARMQARTSTGSTRFADARQTAAALLRRASATAPVALLAISDSSRVLAPLSSDEGALLSALDALTLSDASSRVDDALSLAAELLEARPEPGRIILVSDDATAALPAARVSVEHVVVGDSQDNVGFTRFAPRALLNSPQSVQLLLELVNHGSSARGGSIELSLDGRVIDLRPVELAPGERCAESFSLPASGTMPVNARGWLVARWMSAEGGGDALSLDDVAYGILPRPRPLRVLLVTGGNLFLERALSADDSLRAELLTPDAYQPAMAAAFDAVIIDLPASPDAATIDQLPAGNFLLVGHSPLGPNAGELDRPVVTEAETADPLLRLADLREVNFLRAAQFPFDARQPAQRRGLWRLHAPLRSLDHALILAGEREGSAPQRFVALAFGAADSDLPLRVAFPLFLGNAIRWLAGTDALAVSSLRAGETVRLLDGQKLCLDPVLPGGAVNPAGTRWVDGPSSVRLLRNGFHLRRDAAGAESWLAVNTGDAATSDLQMRSDAPAAQVPLLAASGASWRISWPPWILLAFAALGLSAAEWILFHRRKTE